MLIAETVRFSANAQNDFNRFGNLSTNDIIAKFTPNDLDLPFEGEKF